jgi:hypothetical protein
MLCRLGTEKQTEIITAETFKQYDMGNGAMSKMLWPYIQKQNGNLVVK